MVSVPYRLNSRGKIWDLFEGRHLFGDIFDGKGGHDPFRHVALMAAVAGPPPGEFVRRSETTGQCFGPDGKRRILKTCARRGQLASELTPVKRCRSLDRAG